MNKFGQSATKYDKVYVGIGIAIVSIMVAYAVVLLIFEGLVAIGWMDDPIGEAYEKLNRTIWLIALCSNIVGIQVFSKRKSANIQRGIAIVTVIAAATWLYFYKDSLFVM